MKKLKMVLAVLGIVGVGFAATVPVTPVAALDPLANVCEANSTSAVCDGKDEQAPALIGNLVNGLLFVVGVLSVVMIIVAGVMYTTSTGDSGKVSRAKNTLTYAIVGLVVAFLAYAMVNWVFNLFNTPASAAAAS